MKRKSTIAKYSLEEIKSKRARGEDQTRSDAPEAESLGPDFWKSARIVLPRGKKAINMRVDADMLDWFKSEGPGYLTRMHTVLRSYYEAKTVKGKASGRRIASVDKRRRS
jgi:uncharacterized protein (DUF4415 family)